MLFRPVSAVDVYKRQFVGYILLEHDFYVHLAVLITSQFVSELLIVFGQPLDFLDVYKRQGCICTSIRSRLGKCIQCTVQLILEVQCMGDADAGSCTSRCV